MKKYIIIAGVPRAGKSTVSKRIAKEIGYQHISMDSILAGIEKIFPETKIDTNAKIDPMENFRFISSKVAPFIKAMINSGEYEECDYGVVIDVHQLTPQDYKKYISDEKAEAYFFITPDISPKERFDLLKRYDTPNDYTYFHSDEENMNDCIDIVKISNWLKKECMDYGVTYIDTTYNRANVINEFMEKLTHELNSCFGKDEKRDKLIEYIMEIQSMAQSALFYVKDVYDKERFERLRDISAEMMALKTELPLETVKTLFCSDYGYQTPKVDTRAAIFKDDKILLVHEENGTWSMPGGWCEFNMSPVDNTMKETKEEAGKDIRVKSVISVQNRDNHNVPPYAYGIVKIFYLCEEVGGEFEKNHETTEIAYFAENELPDMAPEKCNEEQVHMCFDAYYAKHWTTQFD